MPPRKRKETASSSATGTVRTRRSRIDTAPPKPAPCCVACSAVLSDVFHKCDVCDMRICETCIYKEGSWSRGVIIYCQGCVASACSDCSSSAGFRECVGDSTCSECAPNCAPSGCYSCSKGLVVHIDNGKIAINGGWKTYEQFGRAQRARDGVRAAQDGVRALVRRHRAARAVRP